MMNVVLYLCHSFDNESGLVFPNELPEDYYSPGIWLVPKNRNHSLKDKYEFDACIGDEIITLDLVRTDSEFGYIVTYDKIGTVLFRLDRLKNEKEKYIGKYEQFKEIEEFYQVVPYNIMLLERLCIEKRFFFVGRSINEF